MHNLKKIRVFILLMGWLGAPFVAFSQNSPTSPVQKVSSQPVAPLLGPILGDWMLQNAQDYQEQLKSLHAEPVSPSEKEKIKARIADHVNKKNVLAAVADQEFLAGMPDASFQDWFSLALLLKERANLGEKLNYEANSRAQKAGYLAYTTSKAAAEKAAALLIMAATYDLESEGENTQARQLYDLAAQLCPLETVRAAFPPIRDLMVFQFKTFALNNEEETPGVCFRFSGTLQHQNVKISDYIHITPALDSEWQQSGAAVCALNLKFGQAYKAVIKKGLPALSGEKLAQDAVVTFKVTDRSPRLSFVPHTYVLMKGARRGIPLSSLNVDKVNLKILRINDRLLTPRLNENGFASHLYSFDVDKIEKVTGRKLWKGTMAIAQVRNQSVITEVPFTEVIRYAVPGVYLLHAQYDPLFQQQTVEASQWVVITDLGLSTFAGVEGLQVFVRSLATAKPVAGVTVKLIARNNAILSEAETTKEGKVTFDPGFFRGKGGEAPLALYAYGPEGDFSLLSLKGPAFDLSDRGVSGREMPKAMDTFLYTERGVYRGGEKVCVTGLLRNADAVAVDSFPLTLKLLRPGGVEVRTDLVKTNLVGAFVQTYDLGPAAQTGKWTLLAYADRKREPIGSVEFSVEDFVPARLDFSLTPQQPFLEIGRETPLDLTGHYLFGAPAAGLKGEVQLVLRRNTTPFPAFKAYFFGLEEETVDNQRSTLTVGPTDTFGKMTIPLLVSAAPDTSHPLEAQVLVSLFEAGGRPRGKDLRLPLLKKATYLGIKPLFQEKTIDQAEAAFEVIALDEKGTLHPTPLDYTLFKEEMQYTWYQENPYSPWQYKAFPKKTPLSSGHFSTAGKAVPLKLAIADWGQYRLVLKDPKTGAASSYQFSKGWTQASSQTSPDTLLVRLDQKTYRVRDTVQVYIKAPFAGEAQLLVMNNKILESRAISLPADGLQVSLTVTENWGAGAYIAVTAYNPLTEMPKTKTTHPKPKRAIGLAWAGINLEERRLHVDIDVPEKIRPRQTLPVTLKASVLDKAGVKKPAEKVYLTLSAVDEGVLSLTDFVTPDPLGYFLGKRRLGVEMRDLYGQLIETGRGHLGTLKTGGAALMARKLAGITRGHVKPVALFSGLVTTDASGSVTLPLQIPDFNGKIRLMVAAFTTKRYGCAQKDVLVQDPLVFEVSPPRFLAPEDTAILAYSLHPTTEKAGGDSYTLQSKGTGSVAFEGPSSFPVTLPDKKVFYGDLSVKALKAGAGTLNLTLKSPHFQTVKDYPLTVRSVMPPLTVSRLERLAAGAEKKIYPPKMLSGLSLEESDLYLRATAQLPWDMTLLLKSLANLRVGSAEQVVNQVFPLLYIKTLQIYPPELKSLEKVKDVVESLILRLVEQQTSQGAFSAWGDTSDDWLTAYVLDFWIKAQKEGYIVPDFALKRGVEALTRRVQRTQPTQKQLPALAYALYVLAQVQQVDLDQVRYFYETYESQMVSPLERARVGAALALLGDLLRAEKAFLKAFSFFSAENKKALEGGQLGFSSRIRDGAAVVALAFETTEKIPSLPPFQEKILSVVDTLSQLTQLRLATAAEKSATSAFSAQEKSWLLIAGQFLQNRLTPAPLSLYLNQEPVAQTGPDWEMKIAGNLRPLKGVITLKNTGKEPVWLITSTQGVPLKNEPAANGISLERRFYTPEGQEISLEKVAQNTQIVVVLSGKALTNHPHQLLFVDLLPAGFEIENARIGQGNAASDLSWLKDLSKIEQTEVRDDRFVAMLQLLEESRDFKLAYIVRAVTRGTFTYPPSFVEDMFAPLFFNRTAVGKLIVTP